MLESRSSGAGRDIVLTDDAGVPSFATPDQARQWIEDEGRRQTPYTILEVFEKR